MDLARFTGTTAYVGRVRHPEHGLIHVLGYQNIATNLATGPNAMLLHLPATTMTARNFVDVGRDRDVLDRMRAAIVPTSASADDDAAWMSVGAAVEVFEHDIYTVVLAADATLIPAALSQVPERRRPKLNPDLFAFYARHYPEHQIAVCCFDNLDASRAKPLLMWYPPIEPDRLVIPALDCHTGAPPDLDERVDVDHWVMFGTDEGGPGWGSPVSYAPTMRAKLRPFLTGAVFGDYFQGPMRNGDFAIDHADLLAQRYDRILRISRCA
ncbi:MAG TPA: hypothetical protein VJ914_13630 [Pseudonocardiaceae bacterium]|nr:hypothetical protein [Pseudonocardiaceae bacterium]